MIPVHRELIEAGVKALVLSGACVCGYIGVGERIDTLTTDGVLQLCV